MIVLDTSFLFALVDPGDERHAPAAGWYRGVSDELTTTPLAVAEFDYLVRRRLGRRQVDAMHGDLLAGSYGVEWRAEMLDTGIEVAQAYAGLDLSLTDASLVALAAYRSTVRIATFDERHFRAVRPLAGGDAFTILPADA